MQYCRVVLLPVKNQTSCDFCDSSSRIVRYVPIKHTQDLRLCFSFAFQEEIELKHFRNFLMKKHQLRELQPSISEKIPRLF